MYSNSVQKFSEDMERKLELNKHKGHWRGCPILHFRQKIIQKVGRLGTEIVRKNTESVKDECVHIANFAMMIYENCEVEIEDSI
jgi:hypothetical protein